MGRLLVVPFRDQAPETRKRRTKAQLAHLFAVATGHLARQTGRIPIRHLCYLLAKDGTIQKTERAFKAFGKLLTKWRRAGAISWKAFSDATRWHYGSRTHDNLTDALAETIKYYRRNLWAEQDVFIEIWCEKDAIASILLEAADPFGVRVLPFRGFSGLTTLEAAAETFREQQAHGKEVWIYYFGDWDPSGRWVELAAIRALREDFHTHVHFVRVAVTPDQIKRYKLPTRPTKVDKNRHAKRFGKGRSVDIDAMPREILIELVDKVIVDHIEPQAWTRLQRVEQAEMESAGLFLEHWIQQQTP